MVRYWILSDSTTNEKTLSSFREAAQFRFMTMEERGLIKHCLPIDKSDGRRKQETRDKYLSLYWR